MVRARCAARGRGGRGRSGRAHAAKAAVLAIAAAALCAARPAAALRVFVTPESPECLRISASKGDSLDFAYEVVPNGAAQHIADTALTPTAKWEGAADGDERVRVELSAPRGEDGQRRGWFANKNKSEKGAVLYTATRDEDVVSLPTNGKGEYELCFYAALLSRTRGKFLPVLVDLHYLEARRNPDALVTSKKSTARSTFKNRRRGKRGAKGKVEEAAGGAGDGKDAGVLGRIDGVDSPVRGVNTELKSTEMASKDQAVTGEILEEFAEELKRVNEMVVKLRTEQKFFEKRDKRHLLTLDSTDMRVEYLALMKFLVVLISGLAQVYVVKSFFEQSRPDRSVPRPGRHLPK